MKQPAPSFKQITTSVLASGILLSSVGFASAQVAAEPTIEQISVESPQDLASQITLTAIPPRLGEDNTLMALPGQTIQTSVRVRNESNQPLQFNTLAQDFIIDQDGETPLPVRGEVSMRWSLASWITLVPQKDTIQPRETVQVDVVIEIPQDALPGGHYAMITHQPLPLGADPVTDSASAVNQRVGTLVYLIVDGPINEEAFLRNITIPSFTEFGPVPFAFTVDNQSDIHIKPNLTVTIYNLFGAKVETIDIEGKNIFPLFSRDFQGQWDRVWGIGPYTAKITMSYGSQGAVVIGSERFWLLPISLVIAAIAVILSTVVIGIALRRHYLHRNDVDKKRVKALEERLAELEGSQLEKYQD